VTIQAAHPVSYDEAFKALSNPVRRKILAQLKHPEQNFPGQEHPYEWGVCAGKIESACSLSQSTISAHLASLHQAGLITAKKCGQWIFYKRDEAAIAAILSRLHTELLS
jgi:DNA-binding transcriptional ArsR family regulator